MKHGQRWQQTHKLLGGPFTDTARTPRAPRLVVPRGKVIGGSSSINGMVYVRGHAKDFDHWQDSGAKGWSFADVLPYFKRQENWDDSGHGGDASWRGSDGPLHVRRGSRENPLNTAFERAAEQAGYAVTLDYNGARQKTFFVVPSVPSRFH